MKKTFKKLKTMPMYVLNLPLLALVKSYQVLFSFDHGIPGRLFPGYRVCRHHPSCSQYAYMVIEEFGPVKGPWLAFVRVLKCGPWTPANTYDPPPKNDQ